MRHHTTSARHVAHVRTLVCGIAGVLALAACSDGGQDAASDPEPLPEATAPEDDGDGTEDTDTTGDDDATGDDASDDGSAGGDTTDTGGDDVGTGAPALETDASAEDREQEPVDAALSLVDVRVGTHDGFDRVVFELAGDGEAGWYLSTDEEARAQGSGNVVDVAGDAVLTVDLVGALYPMDAPDDVTTYDRDRLPAPSGAAVLTEVIDGAIFEGHHQLFVGLTGPVEYRVDRLEDPQRVVIDLLHP
ncbi:MAG: hypothetical protein WEB09_10555 [Nitriliruptor sp.]